MTSSLYRLHESMNTGSTPRSADATPTNRMTLPGPTEYPSLFDVRDPSSTRSADGSAVFSQIQETKVRMPQSARASSSTRIGGSWPTSGRTALRKKTWFECDVDHAQSEEERAYLSVCHHNLHSVLTNPKANSWGDTLLDAFYPSLDVDIALTPFPGLADVSTPDFQLYLSKFGANAAKYEINHVKPIREQLSSSNVPSISVAYGNITFHVMPSYKNAKQRL